MQAGRLDARKQYLKDEFQHIRILAYHIIKPYLSKKDQHRSIAELIPDIYAEESKKPLSLKEQREAIIERYKKAGYFKK